MFSLLEHKLDGTSHHKKLKVNPTYITMIKIFTTHKENKKSQKEILINIL